MPRRYYEYKDMLGENPEYYTFHFLSSIGSYVLAAGMCLVLAYLIHSLVAGRRAPANPWGGATLEWRCSTPPPHDNFATPPAVGDPYAMRNVEYDQELQAFVPVEQQTT
jgi:cytochrome c oxidase subunit 1